MGKYDKKNTRTRSKEDELEKSYRGLYTAPKRKGSKNQETADRRTAIIFICAGVIALSLIVLVACLFLFNNNDGTIVNGVSIAGVNVSGLSKDDAVAAVSKAVKDTYGKTVMAVTVIDHTVEIPADAVTALDVESAVEAALQYGNTGSNKQRQAERNEAKLNGYVLDLTLYLNLNQSMVMKKINELGTIYNSTLSKHTYEVTGKRPTEAQIQAGTTTQTLKITLGTPEFGLDTNALYKQIVDAYNKNQFAVTGHCSLIEPEPLDLQGILDEYGIAPVNAELKPGSDTPTPGKLGYGFVIAEVTAMMEAAKPGSTIEIPFKTISPEVTTESLYENFCKDVLAAHTTTEEKSSNDRNTNLHLACEAINGYILDPGDVFSYNAVLGERTEARGYKYGPSYAGGNDVLTIGGGICQVSSTLYHCTIVAGLEILERDSHGYAPAYTPLGTDAMVSWGSTDFQFRNNTGAPLQIVATSEGGSVTVTIRGTIGNSDLKDNTVKIRSEILEEIPCTTRYEAPPAGNPDGYKNGDYMVTPHKGYQVDTYRCVYSKDGTLLSEEKIDHSSYSKRDGVICEIPDAPITQDPDIGNQGIGGSGGMAIGPSGSI